MSSNKLFERSLMIGRVSASTPYYGANDVFQVTSPPLPRRRIESQLVADYNANEDVGGEMMTEDDRSGEDHIAADDRVLYYAIYVQHFGLSKEEILGMENLMEVIYGTPPPISYERDVTNRCEELLRPYKRERYMFCVKCSSQLRSPGGVTEPPNEIQRFAVRINNRTAFGEDLIGLGHDELKAKRHFDRSQSEFFISLGDNDQQREQMRKILVRDRLKWKAKLFKALQRAL
ncbi:hypothetical protein ANCCAN_01285 [Ancylostoma caninum]|uniref:Uncharacterized protein n=1 Tax=Ancylostoma caninum TaxID=29170 RepID=A0A368H7M6_ANCCA|nr:hypothetical protein ANCCAN_01285 [Ancylostoma caninum]